jgi:two-component system NtrC family sensor kinase
MAKRKRQIVKTERPVRKPEKDFAGLTRRLLLFANIGVPRDLYLRMLSKLLLEGTACDVLEIRTTDGDLSYRWRAAVRGEGGLRFGMKYYGRDEEYESLLDAGADAALAEVRRMVFERRTVSNSPYFTENGSFWTADGTAPAVSSQDDGGEHALSGDCKSVAMVRFEIDRANKGLLELASHRPGHFTKKDVAFFEDVAQAIGITIADRRAQRALRERVKELTCLYGIAQAAQRPDASLEDILARIVALVPAAMEYPEVAQTRVVLDGRAYETSGFTYLAEEVIVPIIVGGEERGALEVGYTEAKDQVEGFVFPAEERNLLEAVARQVSLIVERRESEDERARIGEQLRHADRLATIGQLAAGVAHELNEPLGNVLGFAELILQGGDIPEDVRRDVEKISGASLHAREVVKKLLIFGRQIPTKKTRLDLNDVVGEGLFFLESRCAKEGIKLKRVLAPQLPAVDADRSQLTQVLVNLVVNAVHATPAGGRITVSTRADSEHVYLAVEDTGTGMTEEVSRQVFLPFFTTKDVGEGTGLGLSVVHGIVKAHGGSIQLESEVGKGSRFEVTLPRGAAGNSGRSEGHD